MFSHAGRLVARQMNNSKQKKNACRMSCARYVWIVCYSVKILSFMLSQIEVYFPVEINKSKHNWRK